MKPQTQTVYDAKVQKAIAYIHANLDRTFSFEDVAEHVHLSPYHFHRIFRHQSGETLAQATKRIRLQRAAYALIKSNKPIQDLASEAGFSDTSTFSRAFQGLYGQSPLAYRQGGMEREMSIQTDAPDIEARYEVSIVEKDDLVLTTLDHKGHYMEIGQVFDHLTSSISQEAMANGVEVWGLYYDDPGSVETAELRSKAAVTAAREDVSAEGAKTTVIGGGRFAKILYQGPYNELDVPYRWLYETWLLNSGETLRNEPCIEQYINSPHENAPKDLLTEIYLPLE